MEDVLLEIFRRCSAVDDVGSLLLVCKEWNRVARRNQPVFHYISVRNELWRFHPEANVSLSLPPPPMQLLDVKEGLACFGELTRTKGFRRADPKDYSYDIRVYNVRTGQVLNLPCFHILPLDPDDHTMEMYWTYKQPIRVVSGTGSDSKFQVIFIHNFYQFLRDEFVVYTYVPEANEWEAISSSSIEVIKPSNGKLCLPPWMFDPATVFYRIFFAFNCHDIGQSHHECVAYNLNEGLLAHVKFPPLPEQWEYERHNPYYVRRGNLIHASELFTYNGYVMVAYIKLDTKIDQYERYTSMVAYGIIQLHDSGDGMEWRVVSEIHPDSLYGEGWCTGRLITTLSHKIQVHKNVVVFVEDGYEPARRVETQGEQAETQEEQAEAEQPETAAPEEQQAGTQEEKPVLWPPVFFDIKKCSWELLSYPERELKVVFNY